MGLKFPCTHPGPPPPRGHCSLICTTVSACIGADPVAESKGWEGRRATEVWQQSPREPLYGCRQVT